MRTTTRRLGSNESALGLSEITYRRLNKSIVFPRWVGGSYQRFQFRNDCVDVSTVSQFPDLRLNLGEVHKQSSGDLGLA
jgi:hypothetical protein